MHKIYQNKYTRFLQIFPAYLCIPICLSLLTGCVTLLERQHKVLVVSYPYSADVYRDGLKIGSTPSVVNLERKSKSPLVLRRDSFPEKELPVTPVFNFILLYNLTNFWGYLIDVINCGHRTFKERSFVTSYFPENFKAICNEVKTLSVLEKNSDEIIWSNDAPLTYKDFRDATEKKIKTLFSGYTCSGVFVEYNYNDSTATVVSATKFIKSMSYIMKTQSAIRKRILFHEQIHFDITELSARIFRKKLASTTFHKATFKETINRLLSEAILEQNIIQATYDNEVYRIRRKEKFWKEKIVSELNQYAAYKATSMVIHFK